ncbi:MAG TPA: hypothetical protein VMI31_01075, partial [Fimbriimonadaceae bacterium]|nr:hypothetical protein [Fimbriimonadaceae bacterium]
PMHCVALGSANRLISGDIYGRAAQMLGPETMLLLTNGACGDLNPPEEGVPVEIVDSYAARLADALGSHPIPQHPASFLSVQSRSVLLEYETMDEREILAYAERVRPNEWARREWPDKFEPAVDQWTANRLRELREGTQPKVAEIELQTIRLGDTVWIAVNAEIFSEMVPEGVTVVAYANGLAGYIPTESAFDEGGYEVELACLFYDALPFRRGAGRDLTRALA